MPSLAAQTADRVSFDISPEDRKRVLAIVKRTKALAAQSGFKLDVLSTTMDLTATHANGCPMDFAKLLAADDFNLCHDVYGIARHLDRETGELTGFFHPRCAAKVAEAA